MPCSTDCSVVRLRSECRSAEREPVEGEQKNIELESITKNSAQHCLPTSLESSNTTTKEEKGLNWTAVSETDPTEAESINRTSAWESIQPGEVIKADEIELDKASNDVLATIEPSGTTFANDKALWRDEQWHPQISSLSRALALKA